MKKVLIIMGFLTTVSAAKAATFDVCSCVVQNGWGGYAAVLHGQAFIKRNDGSVHLQRTELLYFSSNSYTNETKREVLSACEKEWANYAAQGICPVKRR